MVVVVVVVVVDALVFPARDMQWPHEHDPLHKKSRVGKHQWDHCVPLQSASASEMLGLHSGKKKSAKINFLNPETVRWGMGSYMQRGGHQTVHVLTQNPRKQTSLPGYPVNFSRVQAPRKHINIKKWGPKIGP